MLRTKRLPFREYSTPATRIPIRQRLGRWVMVVVCITCYRYFWRTEIPFECRCKWIIPLHLVFYFTVASTIYHFVRWLDGPKAFEARSISKEHHQIFANCLQFIFISECASSRVYAAIWAYMDFRDALRHTEQQNSCNVITINNWREKQLTKTAIIRHKMTNKCNNARNLTQTMTRRSSRLMVMTMRLPEKKWQCKNRYTTIDELDNISYVAFVNISVIRQSVYISRAHWYMSLKCWAYCAFLFMERGDAVAFSFCVFFPLIPSKQTCNCKPYDALINRSRAENKWLSIFSSILRLSCVCVFFSLLAPSPFRCERRTIPFVRCIFQFDIYSVWRELCLAFL